MALSITNTARCVAVSAACLFVLLADDDFSYEKNAQILGLVVTINGVFVAVIATFLYSKVLGERVERIVIKTAVDEISLKINYLRRASRVLIFSSEFWLSNTREVELNYPEMDLFSFRELGYSQMSDVLRDTKLSELTIQAYFALRMLRGDDYTQLMVNPNYRKNYTLDDISEFSECCHFVYAYTEEYHDRVSIKAYDRERITSYLKQVDSSFMSASPKNVGVLFSVFASSEIDNLYTLTSKLASPIGRIYQWTFFDMFVSFVVLLISVLGLCYGNLSGWIVNLMIILSLLVGFDLLVNTFEAIVFETKITDFYK